VVDFSLERQDRRFERVVVGKRQKQLECSALCVWFAKTKLLWAANSCTGGWRGTNSIGRVFGTRKLNVPLEHVGVYRRDLDALQRV
jgi:hypothetical protein